MPYHPKVVFEACMFLPAVLDTHAALTERFTRWELPEISGSGIVPRCHALAKLLHEEPARHSDDGVVGDLVVDEAIRLSFQKGRPAERLLTVMGRYGLCVDEEGRIRTHMPEVVDLPATDDELHALLAKHTLMQTAEHLTQAMENHAQGRWASANAQLRAFLESLFDECAMKLAGAGAVVPGNSRDFLSNLVPPFLDPELNEWGTGDGKNFINGLFKRFHPDGSHPGLSDDEDSTFRLHVAVIVGRHYLRRLDRRL